MTKHPVPNAARTTTPKDQTLTDIGELIDARITERLLAFSEGIEEDFGLVRVKPKSSAAPAVLYDDD